MSLPRYSAYRAARVPWMAQVPTHWAVCSLGHRYDVALGKMLDEKRISGDHLAPYLRNVDVQWAAINTQGLPQMDFSGADIPRYSLKAGDLLVCEGGEVGRAAIWDGQLEECYYQKALHRLRPRTASDTPRFFLYVLRAAAAQNIFSGEGGRATIAHLPAETFRRICFPFPPIEEQELIADFLDRETSKIDVLIGEQEKLLALLAEKRQTTISHAVTRGLHTNAPMKDSGTPWIGMVPRHWDVVALKRLGWLKGGSGFPHEEQGSQEGELEFHKVASLGMADENGVLGPVQDHVSRETAARLGAYVFPRDAIVFAKVGAALMLGRICLLREASCIDNNMMGFVVSDENCVQYVKQAMTLVRFDLLANPGAVPSVNGEQIGNFLLPRPPVEEQREVARFLASETAKLTAAEDEVRRSVALLRERRSSIITAAVTGQIDVRAATA